MPADPSIYGLIKAPPAPLEQYGQVLNLKALMGQGKLQDLQTQAAERTAAQDTALDKVFASAPEGATLESLVPAAIRANPKAGIELQGKALDQQVKRAGLAHTTAQTGEITAGHIAGAWAALAKTGGSDDGVKAAHDLMAPLVGEQQAAAVTQKLLSMPPETRLAYAVSQAGQHKVGQEALKLFFPAAHMQDTGGAITPVSTSTLPGGAPAGTQIPGTQPIAKTETPAGVEAARANKAKELHNDLMLAETKRHHSALEGDPQTIEDTAQAISKGQLAPLSGFALSRPMAQNIMARVVQINPDFDPTQFATRQKAEKDFATGKQGQSVKSFNVAISHLGTLDQAADALHNGNMQLFNKFGNAYASQTGGTAPTDFNAVKKIVADEIVKAVVGSGGGVADREEAAKSIDAANSPAQLKGVIGKYKELMKGQLDGLRKQYEATTGKADFDKKFLSEEAQGVAHGSPAAAPSKPSGGQKLVPAKGAVQEGYRFKGGDPSKQESWEKV